MILFATVHLIIHDAILSMYVALYTTVDFYLNIAFLSLSYPWMCINICNATYKMLALYGKLRYFRLTILCSQIYQIQAHKNNLTCVMQKWIKNFVIKLLVKIKTYYENNNIILFSHICRAFEANNTLKYIVYYFTSSISILFVMLTFII